MESKAEITLGSRNDLQSNFSCLHWSGSGAAGALHHSWQSNLVQLETKNHISITWQHFRYWAEGASQEDWMSLAVWLCTSKNTHLRYLACSALKTTMCDKLSHLDATISFYCRSCNSFGQRLRTLHRRCCDFLALTCSPPLTLAACLLPAHNTDNHEGRPFTILFHQNWAS